MGTMTRTENSAAVWALTTVVTVVGTLLSAIGALLVRAFRALEAQVKTYDQAHKEHESLDNTRFESMRRTIEENGREVGHRVEKFTDNVTATMGEIQLQFTEIQARLPERRDGTR